MFNSRMWPAILDVDNYDEITEIVPVANPFKMAAHI